MAGRPSYYYSIMSSIFLRYYHHLMTLGITQETARSVSKSTIGAILAV
jgi:hypothetical protein